MKILQTTPLRTSALVLALVALAACGGSGTPVPDDPPPPPAPAPDPLTFSQLENSADDLDNKYDTVAFSDEANIPLSGSAGYEGPFTFDFRNAFDSDENEVNGTGDLTFNFARGDALSGQISDLVREDGTDVSGSLSLNNSSIDRSSGTFATSSARESVSANLTGILTFSDGDVATVNGSMDGDFKGPNREGFTGDIDGSINVGGSNYSIDGDFYTEK
jgi:hypothetical protein